MCKLESQKNETIDHFKKLIDDSQQINNQFDVSLVDTSKSMNDNVEKIKESKEKFEGEMQKRFQKLVDSQRKLTFTKQKLLEDLDFQIKEQIHDLTEDTQHQHQLDVGLSTQQDHGPYGHGTSGIVNNGFQRDQIYLFQY